MPALLPINTKITIHISHHIDASQRNAQGDYDWFYEYDVIEFTDQASSIKLTARSDANTPFEANFLDLKNQHAQQIAIDDQLQAMFKFAIAYLKILGKTKINYLSEYGYALQPPSL